MPSESRHFFPAKDYDLTATLSSGQAFRWRQNGRRWNGVLGSHYVTLEPAAEGILATVPAPVEDWGWLVDYLQLDLDVSAVLRSLPLDEPMQTAIQACRGLRLLRQDPWECLASFILSSTKQIVQIQQIVELVCRRFGRPVMAPAGAEPAHAFPSTARLAALSEAELRDCKMGFRAPYLLAAARAVASGRIQLEQLDRLPVAQARSALMELPGVGPKIANCVLLFAYGFQAAFPVDVWIMKALRELYFPRQRVSLPQLQQFTAEHFGPYAGYAQQYLFHYVRTRRAALAAERADALPSSANFNL